MVAEELHQTLKKVEKEVGLDPIRINRKEILKFNELIDDKMSFDAVIPPGYVMNVTNRVIQQIFIKIGPLFISKIRGLIHVNSEVEFYKPMLVESHYRIKIETTKPIEKTGKMGTYYSVIFNTFIFDENYEALYALDKHEFFFKL
ncbi:MAG: hypothetical protein ACTSR8_03300 [Promethearchaeota archaeon]